MNLTYTRPGELRKPDVEVLPDGRIRITRYIAAGHGDRDYSEVTESVGTTDLGLGTALLVKRGMARIEGKDAIVKTYEVRNAATETKVGLEDVQYGENGLKTVIADWVQMSSGTYVPQTVGTTTSTYDSTCVLRSETMEDDGTTRQIRRVYINKGLLLETNETKNNGALLLKTLVYLNDVPSPNPPTGYTLISTRVENPNGLETTTYTYAKGLGQISQDDEIKNNGALLIRTIRYLTDSSVTANPIATPTGYTNVSYSYSDQDGYRVWTASYAKGNGKISESSETRLSGSLLRSTIVWLTNPSVTTQPTTDPLSGGTIVSQEYADRDGYRVWTVVWAKGVTTSNIIETVDYRNKGKLVVYTRQRLNAAPTTPSATIGGTVVLIEQTTRFEDGYTLYSSTWAEGFGVISNDQETHNQGKLIIYRTTALGGAPAAPSASIGGTVVLINDSSREDSGVTIYDRRWAEGRGVIEKRTQPRDGGLRIETWVSLGQTYDGTFMLPVGVLMAKDNDDIDGVTRWTVSCMQSISGGDPTSGVALSYTTKRPFQYPGRAKAIATSATLLSATRTSFDIYQSPPVDAMVDATIKVSYQTSSTIPALTYTLWNPTEWATIQAFYLAWNQYPKFINQTLPRYRAISGTQTFNGGGVSGYQQTCLGERVYGIGSGTPYYLTVSGGPSAPDGNTYTIEMPTLEPAFISYSGTQYYRTIIVEATIPAQPALPV